MNDFFNSHLEKIGKHALTKYGKPDNFPAGTNGPHRDYVTNCRIVAHYTILFYHLYRQTGSNIYKNWIDAAIPYLLSNIDKRIHAFVNRKTAGKDPNNGLIGQVWCIEPFIVLHEHLDTQSINMIEKVLMAHGYNKDAGLFLYPTGERKKTSYTLNQQIWFYVILSKFNSIYNRNVLSEPCVDFSQKIINHINLKNNLELNTMVKSQYSKLDFSIKKDLKKAYKLLQRVMTNKQKYLTSSYSLFSLIGIINSPEISNNLIDKIGPDRIIKEYMNNKVLFNVNNEFSWGYNLLGIEMGRLIKHLNNDEKSIKSLIEKQLKPNSFRIADHATYYARHYELSYILDNYTFN